MVDTDRRAKRGALLGRNRRRGREFANGVTPIVPARLRVTTSSAAGLKKVKDGVLRRPTGDNWVEDAYRLVDQVPEAGYVVNLTATEGSKAEWIVQEWSDEKNDWVDSESVEAARIMAAFVGPYGGQRELRRRALLHLAIGGESTLLGSPTEEPGSYTGMMWEFLSSEELKVDSTESMTRRPDGNAGERVSDDSYTARLWKSLPQFSQRCDSPIRRVLPVLREIVRLTQMIDTIATSRLNAGVWYVPESFTFADADDETDEDEENDGADSFTADLIKQVTAPIDDPSDIASLVPLFLRGPDDGRDMVGPVDLARELDVWPQTLRDEALRRLNTGLDVDPAIVEGKSGMNHWGGYQVDQDFVTKHVTPPVELLADFVTNSYLRPLLEVYENLPQEQSRRFRVIPDMSPLMARADEAVSARVLHQMDLLDDDTTIVSNGYDIANKPQPDELARRRAWQVLMANPALLGPVVGPLIPGFEALDWSLLSNGGGLGNAVGGPPSDAPAQTAPVPTATPPGLAPPDQVSGQEPPGANGLTVLVERIRTSADASLERAREKAAAKLVSKARNMPSLQDRFTSVHDKVRALTLVLPNELTTAGLTVNGLLDGAWSKFGQNTRSWVRSWLEARGVEGFTADEIAALAASNLQNDLHAYAAQYMLRDLPVEADGLHISSAFVLRALGAAGAV